jgi:hypothetical protein
VAKREARLENVESVVAESQDALQRGAFPHSLFCRTHCSGTSVASSSIPAILPREYADDGGLLAYGLAERATWLLIYDNVTAPDAIADLLPSVGARVLITSRFSDWSELADEVVLDVLPLAEAIMLRHGLGDGEVESRGDAPGEYDGRKANCSSVWIDARRTVRDQSNPECNYHLEWNDTVSL